MCFPRDYLLLLGCVLPLLNAAPSHLPYEVNMKDPHTDLENTLMTQASQGDNFVASPKPVDISQGFSFNSEPETTNPNIPLMNQPTATTTTTNPVTLTQSPTMDTTSSSSSTITGSKKKRKPVGAIAESSVAAADACDTIDPLTIFNDPFFKFAMQDMLRQQEQFMNSLPFALSGIGMPASQMGSLNRLMSRLGSSRLRMPSYNDLQNSFSTSANNMDLVEDRVIDDGMGKGRIQTFKSKDGTGVMQTMTYNGKGDNGGVVSSVSSTSGSGFSSEQPSMFSWPTFPSIPTRMKATMPRFSMQ